MSLRAQLTLAFTILITLIVTVSGFVAVRSAENNLVSGVDDFLETRVANIGVGPEARTKAEQNLIRLRNVTDLLSEPDSVSQIVSQYHQNLPQICPYVDQLLSQRSPSWTNQPSSG